MFLKVLITLFSLVGVSSAWSLEKVTVGFGDALAPWAIPATNNGILVDIITEALEPAGYEIVPIYYPYLRRIIEYRKDFVDVICDINVNTMEDQKLSGFLSDDAYDYENFAFALKEKGYQFKHLNDLGNVALLSWKGATAHLGDEYFKMATSNPLYFETNNQESQIKMLFHKRVDAVQLDKRIFEYYRSKGEQEGLAYTTNKIDSFPLFGSSSNSYLFHDEKVRDDFNRGLKALKESGRYAEILKSY